MKSRKGKGNAGRAQVRRNVEKRERATRRKSK
jgi:hypothetical protein